MPRPTMPALVRPSSGGMRPTAPTGLPSEDPGVGPEGEGGAVLRIRSGRISADLCP